MWQNSTLEIRGYGITWKAIIDTDVSAVCLVQLTYTAQQQKLMMDGEVQAYYSGGVFASGFILRMEAKHC